MGRIFGQRGKLITNLLRIMPRPGTNKRLARSDPSKLDVYKLRTGGRDHLSCSRDAHLGAASLHFQALRGKDTQALKAFDVT
jgi:hypothetical protein